MSRNVSSKFCVSLALDGSMGGIYGALKPLIRIRREGKGKRRTYIALVIHVGPVSVCGAIVSVDNKKDMRKNSHHGKVGMSFYPGLANSEGGIPLEELQIKVSAQPCREHNKEPRTPRIKLFVS
jgi:hypothetical protein